MSGALKSLSEWNRGVLSAGCCGLTGRRPDFGAGSGRDCACVGKGLSEHHVRRWLPGCSWFVPCPIGLWVLETSLSETTALWGPNAAILFSPFRWYFQMQFPNWWQCYETKQESLERFVSPKGKGGFHYGNTFVL